MTTSTIIYAGPISTEDLNSAIEDANCYYGYLTNRIRIFRERGITHTKETAQRNTLDLVLFALDLWQQNPDGSTDPYDNPYDVAGLNALVSQIRAIAGIGCKPIPSEDSNEYIFVLDFLTDNGNYVEP